MTNTTRKTATDCVDFWASAGFEKWFTKDADFDEEFRRHFLDLHFAAARREHDDWIESPQGALALMILLDQFPRNVFRGTGHMFATDPLARMYARMAIEKGHDQAVDEMLRAFFYLPFEHSEDIGDQELSVRLFNALGGEWTKYSDEHQEIIVRFGRFPHRNPALGRQSTPEELTFLEEGGFSG
ncbi:MAG: DUF924 family protein [Rhizobium sp.]|nr:DUF924 family protein [Rhizobium sp.]